MYNKQLHVIRNLQNGAELILAEKRSTPYALNDKRLGEVFFCAHTGSSMYPTLSEHDLLEIEPYGRRPIRRGDVIFFMPPQENKPAIHRVARISAKGICTRGDKNNPIDPWVLRTEDVIGRVVRAARGKRRRSIYGGRVGQLWSAGIRGRTVVEKGLSFLYHRIAQSGLLRRLVPLHKRMRIVALHQKGGRAFKLLLGHWVIGNYQSGMNYWQIRRPFRLFVDVESLPK